MERIEKNIRNEKFAACAEGKSEHSRPHESLRVAGNPVDNLPQCLDVARHALGLTLAKNI